MKEIIRPIYSALQGYLSQAPDSQSGSYFFENEIWDLYNATIDELNTISGKDYTVYKINPKYPEREGEGVVNVSDYRTKLGGLIARLHGEYFSNEQAPFGGMPSTVINQNQQQSVSLQIQMILEMRDKIDEKLEKVEKGSKESNFLKRIKDSLQTVSSSSQLLSLILKAGKEMGLSLEEIMKLMS